MQLTCADVCLVSDAAAALTVSLAEYEVYMGVLPHAAQLMAKQSRVPFPFTAKGKTADGCGPYGRQFRDETNAPTKRRAAWYASLAAEYADTLATLKDSAALEASAAIKAQRHLLNRGLRLDYAVASESVALDMLGWPPRYS